MEKFIIELKVGDKIDLGRFKNVRSEIKDIKLDQHGQPVIVTNKGEKKALSFRLSKLDWKANLDKEIKKIKKAKKTKKKARVQIAKPYPVILKT